MATLLLEGFDATELPEDYYGELHNVDTYFNIEATVVRTGRSVVCSAYNASGRMTIPFGEDLETVFFGIAFRMAAWPSVQREVFAFKQGGVDQLLVYVDTDGTLVLKRTTTTLGTSTVAMVADTWYYIEMELKITNTIATDDCRIWIDEIEVINPASGDSAATTKLWVDALDLSGLATSGTLCYFDDMYVSNSENLGPVAIQTLFPAADGNYSDFVGSDADSVNNYDLVGQEDLDVATYVDGGSGDKDSYGCDALGSGTIKSVQVDHYAKKTGTGAATLKALTRIGSTDYTGDEVGAPEDFANLRQVWDVSPATAVAWTTAEINAAEFGQEVQ